MLLEVENPYLAHHFYIIIHCIYIAAFEIGFFNANVLLFIAMYEIISYLICQYVEWITLNKSVGHLNLSIQIWSEQASKTNSLTILKKKKKLISFVIVCVAKHSIPFFD